MTAIVGGLLAFLLGVLMAVLLGRLRDDLRALQPPQRSRVISQKFFRQAEAQTLSNSPDLFQVNKITGQLQPYTPFPVRITPDIATDQDVSDLYKRACKKSHFGILIYKDPPDSLARIRIAEARLKDNCVITPIPFAAIEKALPDPLACKKLLSKYTDRYLSRPNFFEDKNAISDSFMFFGRTQILNRLKEDLIRRQGIHLLGLRKTGKTSTILQLGYILRPHPTIHIDLQGHVFGSQYGTHLFNLILEKLSDLIRISPPRLPKGAPVDQSAVPFQEHLIQIATKLENRRYKLPIVLLMDEIEYMLPRPDASVESVREFNTVMRVFRALSQEQQILSFLVAGVHPDSNRINYWSQAGVATNPVFSYFKEVYLTPFSEEDTHMMIEDLGRLMGLEFDEETLKRIHDLSGGQPFIARQLASILYEELSGDTHQIFWPKAQSYLEDPFRYNSFLRRFIKDNIWGYLEGNQFASAMTMLTLLATRMDPSQGMLEEDLINKLDEPILLDQSLETLGWMEYSGLIHRESIDGEVWVRIYPQLFTQWIRSTLTRKEMKQWQDR